jgi:hypothetical protein
VGGKKGILSLSSGMSMDFAMLNTDLEFLATVIFIKRERKGEKEKQEEMRLGGINKTPLSVCGINIHIDHRWT